ncbi:MAG TPA: nitronate monooxygenase [Alphaproteobacteria bacterium]|nr:nitronate monooxygenase [Alphaproteobacteria bacterium]
MTKNRVCEILGIQHPILLAGMGGASTPRLAAAVSEAGGLGVLGAAACGPKMLREWIREIRSYTDKPFAVDTLLPASVRRDDGAKNSEGPSPMDLLPQHMAFAEEFMKREGLKKPTKEELAQGMGAANRAPGEPMFLTKEFFEAQMQVVIEERVPVYAAGLGNPGPWMREMKANGTKVMGVVGAVRHAVQLASAGLDLIVAQGHDGGGHNSPIGTMALIPQVVDAVGGPKGIPVLGAGGICDGRGVAAAFCLGAEGVWIGSAFLASEEAGLLPYQKQAIVDSNEENTMVSKSVTGKPARLIRTKWAQAYVDAKMDPLPMPFQSMVSSQILTAGQLAKRSDIAPGFAGQGIGLIKSVRPARDIFEDLLEGCKRAIAAAPREI